MPQSLSKVYVHIVFSTKNQKPIIKESVRGELQAYLIGILSNLGSYTNEIYCNPDHVHILCTLPRTITIAQMVNKIKSPSSKWLKTKGIPNFFWQDGYGIFSVSSSKVEVVESYIRNQKEHHTELSFKEELRKFFLEYGIEYDEQFVWD